MNEYTKPEVTIFKVEMQKLLSSSDDFDVIIPVNTVEDADDTDPL